MLKMHCCMIFLKRRRKETHFSFDFSGHILMLNSFVKICKMRIFPYQIQGLANASSCGL